MVIIHELNYKLNYKTPISFLFFQVQPYNRKYRSIGHRVWSMSLNILTELSVNSFNEKHNSAEPLAHAQSVIVMQF